MKTSHPVLSKIQKAFAPSLMTLALVAGIGLPGQAAAGCNFNCAYRTISKPVKSAGDKGIQFANDTARKLASFTQNEFDTVRSGTNQVIKDTSSTMTSAYNQALAGVTDFMTDEIIRLLKKRAYSFVNQNGDTISTITSRADKLSVQARAALKRVMQAMPNKNVTSGVMADMQLIASEMGFSALLGSIVKSSWGIGIAGDIGAGPVGANQGIALIMNVNPEPDGSIKGAIATSVGGAVGLDLGVGGSVMIFWQPGEASESTGLALGFGLSLESRYGGGGLEMSFPISTDPKDYASLMAYTKSRIEGLMPGFSLSVDIPGAVITEYKGSVDVNVGWTQVLKNFTVTPSEICKFVTTGVNGVANTTVVPGSACPGASSDSK